MAGFDPVSYMMGQKAAGGGSGSSTLAGLTDVDISNPTNGQTLVYNATSGKWENGESAGGGVLVCIPDIQTGALNHTWQEIVDAGFAILVADSSESPNTFIDYCILLGSASTPSENYYAVWFGSIIPSDGPDEPAIIRPLFCTATANTEYPVYQDPGD